MNELGSCVHSFEKSSQNLSTREGHLKNIEFAIPDQTIPLPNPYPAKEGEKPTIMHPVGCILAYMKREKLFLTPLGIHIMP